MFNKLFSNFKGMFSTHLEAQVSAQLPDNIDPSLLAYDLHLNPGADPTHLAVAGWCFGLPVGISPEQWPLDPESGYPLQHGFTLRLPEAFQVHGQEIVAISFFGAAPEHYDGGPTTTHGLKDIILSQVPERPEDPNRGAFWDHASQDHPRLQRLEDILGCHYAAILLSEAEFSGAPCNVPEIAKNPILEDTAEPQWMRIGGAANLLGLGVRDIPLKELKKNYTFNAIGELPEKTVEYAVPIVLAPRGGDPNAGTAVGDPNYKDPYDTGGLTEWASQLSARCHLGGTMFPCKRPPDVGAQYIEFEECFGNFDFGSGNAQLGLKTLVFDWAC